VADFGGAKFNLQAVLDQILPGLLPLALTMICFVYLRKKNKPVRALVSIFIAAVVFTVLGITK
jgi:PTS system mannose-specific IID component